ncbi:MAG: vWA domain-containing protein [Bacteroidota bacterium]
MKIKIFISFCLFFGVIFKTTGLEEKIDPVKPIDVVFCVDLSGSSNGILDDIRERYWEIVNQVNEYRPSPRLRIAVVGFSRPSFGAKTGYVKIIKGLTSDFDLLSHELYKLQPYIEKGDQMVGMARRTWVRGLEWSSEPDAMKVIYLVGNGRVDLGPFTYNDACDLAIKEGIVINTLYCRSAREMPEEKSGWRNIARLTGGSAHEIIIHKRPPIIVTTPDSSQLFKLSKELAATYIGYGKGGGERVKLMAMVDEKTKQANLMTFESRLFHKISDGYQFQNGKWDIIDYYRSFDNIPDKAINFIPDSSAAGFDGAMKEYVSSMRENRKSILAKLRLHLPLDRQSQLNRMLEERGVRKSDNFERVVINSMDRTAASHGFSTIPTGRYEFSR